MLPPMVERVERGPGALLWPLLLWGGQLLVAGALAAPAAVAVAGRHPASTLTRVVGLLGLAWFLAAAAVPCVAAGRAWIRARRHQLLALTISLGFSLFLLGELGVRLVEQRDLDGNVFVRSRRLHPYRVPVRQVAAEVERYQRAGASSKSLVADRDLGWAPLPGATREPYFFDRSGIRVPSAGVSYAQQPVASLARVALFGDSFTNGIGATQPETWGAQLEQLARARQPMEVLNFGVPAYGMDQALLRFQRDGRRFAPDVVVFGLQFENTRRNLNVMRPFYHQTSDLPLTKPRFLLENGALRPVNAPTLPLERVVPTLAAFESWELAKHEAYYDPADYRARPWHVSHFFTLLVELADGVIRDFGTQHSKPGELELALAILEAFATAAKEAGASFMILRLATLDELEDMLAGRADPREAELARIRKRFTLVETGPALVEQAKVSGAAALYNDSRHYTALGNAVVARGALPGLLAHVAAAPRIAKP
jgi:hypothetical protein